MTEADISDPPATPPAEPPATPPAGTMEPPAAPSSEPPAQATTPDIAAVRQALAGDDEKFAKQLGRYKTLDAMREGWQNAAKAAQTKSEPLKLADDANEEQKAEFRRALGLTDKAEEYPVAFREGYEVSDADKAALGTFKEAMHSSAGDPRTAAMAMDWYQDAVAQAQQDRDSAAAEKAKETQEALRVEYGGEYAGNIEAATGFMRTQLGEEGFNQVLETRFEDGTRLQDNPAFVKMMVNLAADYYGGTGIVTGDVETASKTVDEKLADLQALRTGSAEDQAKYFSDEVQQQVADLYKQKEKLAARK